MKRIIFVDDEPQVLDALRALLRPHRARWDMMFVESGERALAELSRSTYDVIVSDLRMPRMDGAELLKRVQDRHPGVVRIVLSGHAELEVALRTVPVAHQFLAKPCDPELLENVVDRACALQSLIRDDVVRQVVGKVQKLPSLPQTYLELTRVLSKEEAGVAEVARVVERDPTMVAKLLQMVNSAFFGLGKEITSIEQAVAYLGTSLLRDLTLVAQVFSADALPAGGAVEDLARHSLLVGAIARRFAAADKRTAEDAFIAGILHDIGKLILAWGRPEQYAQIVARARKECRPLFEVEQEVWGATHAEVGGYLLGIWGLPYPVIEAAANHHAPGRVPARPGLDVFGAVYSANALLHEQTGPPSGENEPCSPLDEDYLGALGVVDRLPEWRAIVASVVEASAETDPTRLAN